MHKKDFNNSLKEIEENTAKEVDVFKEKQENTTKQVIELNNTVQDLKKEVETIKKMQSETTLKIETLGKKSRTIDASKHQQQNTRDGRENLRCRRFQRTIKENAKCKKILTQNIQEIQDTMRKPNLQIIGVDENEDFQLKGPANIFNKIIEENFPYLKKEMPMNIQETYRTPNRLDQKRNSS
jgi:chromosome segregation ATPase